MGDQGGICDCFLGQNRVKQSLFDSQGGQLRFNRAQVTADIEPIGFTGLRHQIADVEPWGAAALNRCHQLGYQQIGQQ